MVQPLKWECEVERFLSRELEVAIPGKRWEVAMLRKGIPRLKGGDSELPAHLYLRGAEDLQFQAT